MQRLLRLLKKHRPKTAADYRVRIGRLVKLGEGCFRTCYLIPKTRVVIKFPISNNDDRYEDSLYHSRQDIRVIRDILSKARLKALRKYVPRVFYTSPKTGVIVMERLRQRSVTKRQADAVETIFQAHVKNTEDYDSMDLADNRSNFAFDARGQIKVLDYGCIL